MKISKEKFKKLMHRGKGGARAVAAGSKGTAIEALVGAVAAYAGGMAKDKIEFVREKGWAEGAALVAAGHFTKKNRKYGAAGAALIGAGGYSLGQYWKNRKNPAVSAPASAPAAAPPAQSQTQGIDDYPSDTGLIYRSAAMAA